MQLTARRFYHSADWIDPAVQVDNALDVQLQPSDVLDQVHRERRRRRQRLCPGRGWKASAWTSIFCFGR